MECAGTSCHGASEWVNEQNERILWLLKFVFRPASVVWNKKHRFQSPTNLGLSLVRDRTRDNLNKAWSMATRDSLMNLTHMMLSKRSRHWKVQPVQFHLYKVQSQAELVCAVRSQGKRVFLQGRAGIRKEMWGEKPQVFSVAETQSSIKGPEREAHRQDDRIVKPMLPDLLFNIYCQFSPNSGWAITRSD